VRTINVKTGSCSRRLLASAAAISAALAGLSILPSSADSGQAPPGRVTLLSKAFPSRLYDEFHGSVNPSTGQAVGSDATRLFTDPSNHLVFEEELADNGACPGNTAANFFAYDIDTYSIRAQGCLTQSDVGSAGADAANAVPLVAVDSTDGLILFRDQSQGLPQGGKGVVAYSEKTLSIVGRWPVPDMVRGLSWSAAEDALLVLASDQTPFVNGAPSPPVKLYEYNVPGALRGAGTLWNGTGETGITVGPCQNVLPVYWGSVNAYRSDTTKAIFVPCQLRSGNSSETTGQLAPLDGVVKLPMSTGQLGCSASQFCPSGEQDVAVSPAAGTDFFFDPTSARGAIPCCIAGGSDLNIAVYDGVRNAFLSSTNIGGLGTGNDSAFALNPDTGRLYAFTGDGLTQVDLRRTPIPLGNRTPDLTNPFGTYIYTPVLPADAAFPFPRVVVPHQVTSTSNGQPVVRIDRFNVYADAVPIGEDPPAVVVDRSTYGGAVPQGVRLTTESFYGNASGYGMHIDFVGGLRGVIGQWTLPTWGGDGLPFGNDRHDMMVGYVPTTNVDNGTTQAQSIVLGPVDSGTASDYRNCTQLQTLYGTCSRPPCYLAGAAGVSGCPAIPAISPPSPLPSMPSVPATGQQWPYQTAECSQPGPPPAATAAPGLWLTTGYSTPDANGDVQPQETEAPASTSLADAAVNCNATVGALTGAATGSTKLDATMGLQQSGVPTVQIARASTAASATPPGPSGVTSTVTSEADGVHVDLGEGAGLDIGRVTQTAISHAAGRPGTATTSDVVTVSHLVLTDASGNHYGFCDGSTPCSGGSLLAALNQLNAHLPYDNMTILMPAPDDAFAKASGTPGSNGSPGGYEAIVQGNQVEQLGDVNYNEMGTAEAQLTPALRIVMYDDGQQGLTRLVVDLAGTEADSEMAVGLPDGGGCGDCGGTTTGSPFTVGQAGIPPSTTWVPGAGGGGSPVSQTTDIGGPGSGLVALAERFLAGIQWLFRSPAAALQMGLFLSVLLVPPVLMARRRHWLAELGGDNS
jgi:hypothetical protein